MAEKTMFLRIEQRRYLGGVLSRLMYRNAVN